jgi:hypothetical protein
MGCEDIAVGRDEGHSLSSAVAAQPYTWAGAFGDFVQVKRAYLLGDWVVAEISRNKNPDSTRK